MGLGTTLPTMFQRRQKPCHFNADHDTHPLNKIGIASPWLHEDRTTKLLCPTGSRDDASYDVPSPTKAMPLQPGPRRFPLNWMGIASTWLPAHTEQQNCSAMVLGTPLPTMFQRRQKPCHFNADHDTLPLNKIVIASPWLHS
ncbi:hypothetical protein MRX96_058283 [Rhipicephalus microplus]